jgi:ribonuclease Z
MEKILLDDGQLIRNEQLTYDPSAPMSYAFCSDTVYNEEIVPFIAVTVLYHEATFCSQRNVLFKDYALNRHRSSYYS